MTAVRRLTMMLCASLFATSLFAQASTTQTTTSDQTRRTTEPVTAPTDADVTNPNALKLSLADALSTASQRKLGIELQAYDYRMAGEALQSQYGLYDWFGQANAQRQTVQSPVRSTQSEPRRERPRATP